MDFIDKIRETSPEIAQDFKGCLDDSEEFDHRKYIERNINIRLKIGAKLAALASTRATEFLSLQTDDPDVMHKQAKMLKDVMDMSFPVPNMSISQATINHNKPREIPENERPILLTREDVRAATLIALEEQESVDGYKEEQMRKREENRETG